MDLTGSPSRRNPLAYLVVLRASTSYQTRARLLRTVAALVALVPAVLSGRFLLAVPLVLLGLVGPVLNYLMVLYGHGRLRRSVLLGRIADRNEEVDGEHRLNLPAATELAGLAALLTAPSWVTTDLATVPRLTALLMAVAYGISVAQGIFSDHTWFNPAVTAPPGWHEAVRRVAGPTSVALMAVVVLAAPWSGLDRLAAGCVVSLALVVSVRQWDLDETVAVLDTTAEEERRRGSRLVRAETEAALRLSLQRLALIAGTHRHEAPQLYELATHADDQLRDILRSRPSQPPEDQRTEAVLGAVRTLATAVGVELSSRLDLDDLDGPDLQTASWVTRDLVGNAVDAHARHVHVDLGADDDDTGPAEQSVRLSVTDDARPMPPGVWTSPGTSSSQLAAHLISLGGSLSVAERPRGKVVTARWVRRQG